MQMLLANVRRGTSRAVLGNGWLPRASLQRHATGLEVRCFPSTECCHVDGEIISLLRAVAGADVFGSLLTRTRDKAAASCQLSESDRRKASSGSLAPASMLFPSYPAGTLTSGAPSHAAGSGKCLWTDEAQGYGSTGRSLAGSQPLLYNGSTPEWRACSTEAAASASSPRESFSLGRSTRAAASAPNSAVLGFIQQSPSPAVPTLGSESQSNLADVPPPASLVGPPSDQPSPSPDLDVGESVQEPRRQRKGRGDPVGKRCSSEAEAVSAASSSDSAPGLDAAIPRAAASSAVDGAQQNAFASALAPGSTGNDLPQQSRNKVSRGKKTRLQDATAAGSTGNGVSSKPTKRESGGRRTKLPPVEGRSASSSTDEDEGEPKKGRQPTPLTTRRGKALPCPSWDDLMSAIKAMSLKSLTQQGLGGPPEGSADEVLQVLSSLLGLPYETVARHVRIKTGSQKHEEIERLITNLDLYREYGFSTKEVRSFLKGVSNTSRAFIRDPEAVRQILDFLLDQGVTRPRLGAVVATSKAASLSLEGILRPKATFLSSLGARSVGMLLEKSPNLLTTKLSRLQVCAEVLRTALGEEECIRVLERNPLVLTFPTEELEAFILILQGRYHLGPGVLATMLIRVTMFTKSTVDSIEATLDLLESVVGGESVVDVLTRQPQVLLRDPKAIETTIQNLFMLMTPATVRNILLTNPQILRVDWSKRIEPALRYAVERCSMSYEEAVRASVFGKSFEEVLKPRVEFLQSQGMVFVPAEQVHRKKGRQPRSVPWSLSSVVNSSLKNFQTRFPEYRGR